MIIDTYIGYAKTLGHVGSSNVSYDCNLRVSMCFMTHRITLVHCVGLLFYHSHQMLVTSMLNLRKSYKFIVEILSQQKKDAFDVTPHFNY